MTPPKFYDPTLSLPESKDTVILIVAVARWLPSHASEFPFSTPTLPRQLTSDGHRMQPSVPLARLLRLRC
jgi:hypothetical protein